MVSPVQAFGTCPRCGLRFAGEPEDHPALTDLIRLHLDHCAGANRSGEEWVPYREVYESRRCHVVLVDSDPFTRDALRTLLQLEGHSVEEARDGPTAVHLALTREPDVMLIDINLPGFDGYQVARRIHAARLRRPPFLVALTGYGRSEDRRRAREAGFDEYLLKPAEAEEIERVVAAGRLRDVREGRS
jgi:CheY-like chemotaxis protein